jgi:hypothetical protein
MVADAVAAAIHRITLLIASSSFSSISKIFFLIKLLWHMCLSRQ